MSDKLGVRVDKWLWSIRFVWNRDHDRLPCNQDMLKMMRGFVLKPSSEAKIGSILVIGKAGINFSLKVTELISTGFWLNWQGNAILI